MAVVYSGAISARTARVAQASRAPSVAQSRRVAAARLVPRPCAGDVASVAATRRVAVTGVGVPAANPQDEATAGRPRAFQPDSYAALPRRLRRPRAVPARGRIRPPGRVVV